MKYFAAESLMLVTKKDDEYRVPPKLHLQVIYERSVHRVKKIRTVTQEMTNFRLDALKR